MATIATTTNSTPFQYPGQTLLVRLPNSSSSTAQFMCLVKGSTADNYLFYKSTDKGATWTLYKTIVRTNLVDVGQLWLDKYGWLFWAYRTNESSQDRIYMRRINTTDDTLSSGEVLLANPGNGGVAGSIYTGVDIKTMYVTSVNHHYVAVIVGTTNGSQEGVTLLGADIDPSGNISSANYIFSGVRQWMTNGSAGRVGVCADTEQDGGGYDGYPNLWIAFGRNNLNLVKVSWSGYGWTGSSGYSTIYTGAGTPAQHCLRWTGGNCYMMLIDPVNTSQGILFSRDRANSRTTTTRTQTHPTGVIRSLTFAYDTGVPHDVRCWAVGTSTAILYQCDFNSSTQTWGAWGSTGLSAILGAGVDNFGAKRSNYGDARWGLYTAASGAPNTLTYTALLASYAPNAPTWVTPTSGAAADVSTSLTLTWAFSDQDPGDTQGSYAVSRQIGAGALSYWRASDSTWQVAEVQNSSSTSSITIPSSWAAGSDANYTFKAKAWDNGGLASVYSAGLVVVPSVKVNPSITSPTAAQVLTANSVTVTWTATEQTQWRLQLNIQGGAQVWDSGWVGDSASRSYTIPYVLANSSLWTVTLTTANNEGLASTAQTRNFSISYTPPATPTYVLTPMTAAGVIRVAITNPTPGGGQPAVANQDVYRRVVGDSSAGIRIAAAVANNGTYDDWSAVSGVAYQYMVITLGTNGTSASGAWTT